MKRVAPSLAALIGSRICHDLVSPIGAISNGLELLSLANNGTTTPELELVRESCDHANARLKYFRIAFGLAQPGQEMPARELAEILADLSTGSRVTVEWSGPEVVSRGEAQMAFLAAMCLESAMPRGGKTTITVSGDALTVSCAGPALRTRAGFWSALTDDSEGELSPAEVQFALLREVANAQERRIEIAQETERLTLTLI